MLKNIENIMKDIVVVNRLKSNHYKMRLQSREGLLFEYNSGNAVCCRAYFEFWRFGKWLRVGTKTRRAARVKRNNLNQYFELWTYLLASKI